MSFVKAQDAKASAYAGEISAAETWEYLKRDTHAMLIDVRTPAEWAFSGEPDLRELGKELLRVSWRLSPSYALNPEFVSTLKDARLQPDAPLFFICRTGGRSLDAACAMTNSGYSHCYNVTDGFEGPLNGQHRRGMLAGWKAVDLPWVQS